MITVWKYKITKVLDEILIPLESRFLSVQVQEDNAVMWFMVDTVSPAKIVKIRLYNTGEQILESCGEYMGTIQFSNGVSQHLFFKE